MMPIVPEHPGGSAHGVLWEGGSEDATNMLTGGRVRTAAYRLTVDTLYFEAGVLSRVGESIPLWAIMDVDIAQALTQRARGVADLRLRLDPAGYRYGQANVVLRSIRDAHRVRDLIIHHANQQRGLMNRHRHAMDINRRQAGAMQLNVAMAAPPQQQPPAPYPQQPGPYQSSPQPAPPAADSEPDVLAKLERLARLHESGALTDEEFTAAKAVLLR